MKSYFLLLTILLSIINIKCWPKRSNRKERRIRRMKKKEESSDDINVDELNGEEGGGPIMSDEVFEEKLKKVLEEKKIKKNQKITKDILKKIFDTLYNRQFDIPNTSNDNNGDLDSDPNGETKRFMNEIFTKLTKGLDYDDEIKICDIKEYISPNKVQNAVHDIIENLVGMMGRANHGTDL